MEFSMLIGKPLLSPDGENRGYIKGLYVSADLSKLVCLSCADNEEEEFYLPAHAVCKIGDAVIADGDGTDSPDGVPCPVGKAVYDEEGNFLGCASALTGGQNGVLTVAGAFGEKQFPARQIAAGACVIVRGAKSRPSKKRSAAKEPEPAKELFQEPAKEPTVPPHAKKSDCKRRGTAFDGTGYHMDLLGKRALKDADGLLAAGETVTAEILRRAHEGNRLLELASAVLTEA